MPRIVSILSAKGGTGKTTTSINLAAALAQHGQHVIVVDGNLTTPNVSVHLGIPLYPVTLHDVLRGNAGIKQAVYSHASGIEVVPASLSVEDLDGIDADDLHSSLESLFTEKGIIIVDGAAGIGKEARAAVELADEIIIVTNPDMPAVMDALKITKLAQRRGTQVSGVIVNRFRGKKYEMPLDDITEMLGVPILGVIHEDSNVPKSIASKTPLVLYKPWSRAAREFSKVAAALLGEPEMVPKKTILESLLGWLH